MDLKNAAAICLISLFSATLVVLIARALDRQAAARLEPQLERIATELETIRKQGGVAMAAGEAGRAETVDNGVVVYYFHGNTRCYDCRAIESQSYEVVHTDFAAQLESGELTWKTANYEDPADAELTEKFGVHVSVVVLARMKDGQVEEGFKRLDRVWPLVGDKPDFAEYVRAEINDMLASENAQPEPPPRVEAPEIPVPGSDSPAVPVPSVPIPVPDTPADTPAGQ